MKIVLVTLFALFLTSLLVMGLLLHAYRVARGAAGGLARRRFRWVGPESAEAGDEPDILRKETPGSSLPLLNRILVQMPGIEALQRLTRQAVTRHPPGVFVLLALVLALFGFWAVSQRTANVPVSVLVAAALASTPFAYLKIRKRKRVEKFQEQLPEALEMIARGLRAGHAFTTGLKLVADSFEDPLGKEFRTTLEEINFGVGVADALKNLVGRVDCPDLRFFVVATIIQRETGGNMAEIMESIARIQRYRFGFNEKVRVLSSEARLSAKILIALPFLIMAAIRVLNPQYLDLLFTHPMGRAMLTGAAFLIVTGIFVIMRMVRIEI